MYAYSGILAALYERERTGLGTNLEVSLLDALGEWMSQPAYYYGYSERPVRRTGSRHASISPTAPTPPLTGPRCSSGYRTNGSGRCSARRSCGALVLSPTPVSRPTPIGRARRGAPVDRRGSPGGPRRVGGRDAPRLSLASRTPDCALPRSSSTTRSSRRGTDGSRSTRLQGPSAPCRLP